MVSIIFPCSIEPIIAYIFSFIIFKVFRQKVYIYFSNVYPEFGFSNSGPVAPEINVTINAKMHYNDNYINLSRPIKPLELLTKNPTDLLLIKEKNGEKAFGLTFGIDEWKSMTTIILYIDNNKNYCVPVDDLEKFIFDVNDRVIDTKYRGHFKKKTNNIHEIDYENERLTRGEYECSEGAYGYNRDTINSAFEGDPENYWNID